MNKELEKICGYELLRVLVRLLSNLLVGKISLDEINYFMSPPAMAQRRKSRIVVKETPPTVLKKKNSIQRAIEDAKTVCL